MTSVNSVGKDVCNPKGGPTNQCTRPPKQRLIEGVFGAPVRAQRYCVFDDTVNWWEYTSSLRRSQKPSPLAVVSFRRTARVVRGTPTLKTQTCGIGQEGLVGYWRRRDMITHKHRERREDGVEERDHDRSNMSLVRPEISGRARGPTNR